MDTRRFGKVAIFRVSSATYPQRSPYHPPVRYPEYPFETPHDPTNVVYEAVRSLFRLLGLDAEHEATPQWNPLGFLVKPGMTVFVKPNFIAHKNAVRDSWEEVITHGSVLRAVMDYLYIALRGEGRLILADAPQTDSRIDRIRANVGVDDLLGVYESASRLSVEFLDLRDEFWVEKDGIYVETIRLPGDPRGGIVYDLGPSSYFAEVDALKRTYYGAYYDVHETNRHHSNGRHEYLISRTPIEADVFISVPKLKTHKKVGLTVNLKSLVGINANKNWLPHYAIGSPEENGDQFPTKTVVTRLENSLVLRAKRFLLRRNPAAQYLARRFKRTAYRVFGETEEVVRSGNWHGNDTCWRMALDLNRVLLYGNPDGTLRTSGRKPYFSIVDGIVAMEGNGPAAGLPKPCGVLLAGEDPVAVDVTCARLMGFDLGRLPLLNRAFDGGPYALTPLKPTDVWVISNVPEWEGNPLCWRRERTLQFLPHFGWRDYVEQMP